MVGRFKICAKFFTFFDSLAIGSQFVSLKKGIGERAEVFFFEHSLQIGLFVKKRDLRLPEAVAFLTVYIAGVLTVRTVVDRIEKICRVAVFQQKGGTFLCKVFELVFELCKRICIPCEHLFSLCDRGGCNGFVEGLIAGDCLINMVKPLIVQMAVAGLMLFVLPQDGIVLGNSQCHIKPPYCFKSASSSASKS